MATAFWYGSGLLKVASKQVDWAADSIKAALVRSTYTPSQDTHTHYGDISTPETPSGGGYTTGGVVVGTRTLVYDAASNEVRFLGDDVAWVNSTITARYLVLYDDTPAAGSKWLLGYVDFGVDQVSSASTLSVSFAARKLLRITAL